MQDNIRIYFTEKVKFEQIIKKNHDFNCTINSNDIKNDRLEHSIYPIVGQIGTLTYVITQNGAYIENSLHKYHNSNTIGQDINYNDFSYCEITQALNNLQSQIPEYDFINTKITSLEFGFNLKLERSVQDIIKNNILLWNFKPHYFFQDNKGFMMKKFKMSNSTFKIYDKGAQNNLDYPLLRIEIKYNHKQLRNKDLGIITFLDLYNPKKLQSLFLNFLKRFDQLIIVDNRFTSNLSKTEKEYLGNQLEYTYWNRNFGSDSTKNRHKKKFREFIRYNNLMATFHYLKQKITDKYHELFKDCEGTPINTSD